MKIALFHVACAALGSFLGIAAAFAWCCRPTPPSKKRAAWE